MSYYDEDPLRHPPPAPRRRVPVTVWLLPLIFGLLLGVFISRTWVHRGTPALEPREVTQRGPLADDEQATIELFEASSPSVVYVRTVRQARSPFDRRVYEFEQGTGSGFVWDDAGHIVTNHHVVEDSDRARVILWDQSRYDARVVGRAAAYDLAVLRINAPPGKLRPIPVGSSADLKVGQRAYAIGNPFGLDQTLTTGIVSAVGRQIVGRTGRLIEDVIQTDAAINPGNSGGPLLDSAGRVIGVNTAIVTPTGAYAGIGFAVPVDTVNRIIPQLVAHGRVTRPHMGVHIAHNVSPEIRAWLGAEGVPILRVEPGSPAEAAGLRGIRQLENDDIAPGDVIQAINGVRVRTADELFAVLERLSPGQVITVTVWRERRAHDVQLRLDPPRQ